MSPTSLAGARSPSPVVPCRLHRDRVQHRHDRKPVQIVPDPGGARRVPRALPPLEHDVIPDDNLIIVIRDDRAQSARLTPRLS